MVKRRHGPGSIDRRVTADGTVRYRARLRLADGRWRSVTRATEDAADAWLYEMARALRQGTYVEPSRLTVADVVREYVERGARRWRPSTTGTYRRRVERYLAPVLGAVRVVELTTHRVQAWIDGMARQGLGSSIIGSVTHVLSGALKDALRLGVVEHNVAVGVRLPGNQRTQRGERTWTAGEVRQVLDAVATDPQWSALYRLALATGMRPGELRAVQWRDVDLERGTVQVRRTVSRDPELREVIGDRTKSGRDRTIALAPSVVAALRLQRTAQARRRLAHEAWHDLGLVFDRGDGRLKSNEGWRDWHDRLCERVAVRRITLHSLRHSFATLALEQGVHPKIVQEMLGHKSITLTMDTYSHVSVSLQRQAVDALDTWLARATT